MRNIKLMRCPHCSNVFEITLKQFENNTRFKCPKCNRYNDGSMSSEPNGILIGVKMQEVK